MNFSLLAFLAYAIVTGIGMVGLGHIFWTVIKTNCPAPKLSAPLEHPLFIVGLSFFLGYLLYEEFLYLLAAVQLFRPVTVTLMGTLLSVTGIGWLYRQNHSLKKQVQVLVASPLETAVLVSMLLFVYFWNLYPMYDVDSMHDYLPSIVNLLKHGGLYFSPYEWVNYFMGRGENMVYALGLALNPKSSVFAQLLHGISKVMLMLTVYGAARTLGAGTLSLLAPALILSEEHIVASGTNGHVHINIAYAMSLFFLCYSLAIFLKFENNRYFWVSLNSALFAIICKYAALYHALLYGVIILIIMIAHPDIRRQVWKPPTFPFGSLQLTALLIALLPFLFRWLYTHSPVFPFDLGPLHTPYYDKSVQILIKLFHYGISPAEALKTWSSFMVWPGILSSKILFPLAFLAVITMLLGNKLPQKQFIYGGIFFVLSATLVLVQQTTLVFEMRYYRFGIGVYVLSATFFIDSIMQQLFEFRNWLKPFAKPGTWAVVILASIFCVRYSFDVMRDRATFTEILQFTKGAVSETQILEKHYPKYKDSYLKLLALDLDSQQLGLLLEIGWPEFIYPVPGRQIAFGKSGAIPSSAYFDEGSFALELHQRQIRTIYNQEATDPDYPFRGGAAFGVLQRCGSPLVGASKEYLELSVDCLGQLAATKDISAGAEKLNIAIAGMNSRPAYNPFNPPPYGVAGWLR